MRRAIICAVFVLGACAPMSQPPAPAMPPPHDPNDYPSWGYHVVQDWPDYPMGRAWGGVSAAKIDPDGASVWFLDRCGGTDGACAKSDLPPVMQYGLSGKLLRSWGSGMFRYPHGLYFDKAGHVWTADGISNDGAAGQVVREWTKDGKLLLTMGEWGVGSDAPDHFNGVSDMLIAPDGAMFIADGHNAKTNNRILKLDRDRKLVKTWGKLGDGPGEFNQPHGLALDGQGRLYVADRGNSRIQIFDQDGNFLAQWRQFGRPSGIVIKGDMIYVADSLSSAQNNPGFKNGIRWGHVSDGKVIGFIPWGEYNAIEAIAVDRNDNMYVGFTNVPRVRKFVRD